MRPSKKKRNKIAIWRLDKDDDDDDDNDDGYFATPNKCNNNAGKQKHKKSNTTINSDFILGAEFGNEGTADNVDDEEGEDNNTDDDDDPMEDPPKKYGMTEAKDWAIHAKGGGRPIEPVPYTGDSKLFKIKLADGDLDKMRKDHGAICFRRVFEWLLPMFSESGFYKFIGHKDAESHDLHHH